MAEGGKALWHAATHCPPPPTPSMAVRDDALDFSISKQTGQVRVIRAAPDQIVTGAEAVTPTTAGDEVVTDTGRDLLKIAVVERHSGSGRVGLGLVTGIGASEGSHRGHGGP